MNAKRNLSRSVAALLAIGSLASISNVALAEDENPQYTLARAFSLLVYTGQPPSTRPFLKKRRTSPRACAE